MKSLFFLPVTTDTYRDAKMINKELYLENKESLASVSIDLSEIFKDINVMLKETMEETEVEEKIHEELGKNSQKVDDVSYEFNFFKPIIRPTKNTFEATQRQRKFDNVTEKVLLSCKPSISDSLYIFGIDPNESFEKREKLGKFNTFSETTLSGFKVTNSEIFDERKKYDTFTLDCSKETILKAYITYIYIFKAINETKSDILKHRLIGLKNSLNIYLIYNKSTVDFKNFEAFSYVYDNSTNKNRSHKSSLLRELMGESLVNLNSVEYIFRKLNRLDDFKVLEEVNLD
jgi:hypothetical protein